MHSHSCISLDHLASIGLPLFASPHNGTIKQTRHALDEPSTGVKNEPAKAKEAKVVEKTGVPPEGPAQKTPKPPKLPKPTVEKSPDVSASKTLDLMEPTMSCNATCFSFQNLVAEDGVDRNAFPNLTIDFSNAHLPNPEQETPDVDDKLLKDNLRDCLKTFADFGFFNGKCKHHHPINLYIHPPVYTCEQAEKLVQPSRANAGHMKNLFIKDKKKNLFLISALVDTEIKLGKLKLEGMASGGASFASSDVLLETLGLIPGSVTPFGLINDSPAKVGISHEDRSQFVPKITYYLDENAFKYEHLAFHPNACNATVDVHRDTFVEFIEKVTGHRVNTLEAC